MAKSTQSLTYAPKRRIGNNIGYLIAIVFASVVLAMLQYQYWYGEYGHVNLQKLELDLKDRQRLIEEQMCTNSILVADVQDLKSGLSAIEEHARLELGLIKQGEVFMQLSNAPITYSRQVAPSAEDQVEAVDAVPEAVAP